MMSLREARVRRRLSQRGLAERAGVARVTVSHIERGKTGPRPHVARRLSAALDVMPYEIVEFRPALARASLRQPAIRAMPDGMAADRDESMVRTTRPIPE